MCVHVKEERRWGKVKILNEVEVKKPKEISWNRVKIQDNAKCSDLISLVLLMNRICIVLLVQRSVAFVSLH